MATRTPSKPTMSASEALHLLAFGTTDGSYRCVDPFSQIMLRLRCDANYVDALLKSLGPQTAKDTNTDFSAEHMTVAAEELEKDRERRRQLAVASEELLARIIHQG